jgi:hypothetical protein
VIEALAITDRPPPGAGLPDGLELAGGGEVVGVYRVVAERPAPSRADDLWRHDELIESLMAERAVLPLRYGTVLDDARALERILAERSGEFAKLLDRVRGRVELAVRVMGADDGDGSETPDGESYMRELARRRTRGARAAALLAPLESVADASVARDAAGEAWTRRAYLVQRGRLEEFRHELDRLTGERPELEVTCTGPWAPYSFVSEEAA